MTLEIKGCDDCPFLYDYMMCTHPTEMKSTEEVTETVFDFIGEEGSPYWCPLKQEPITINLK